MQCLLPPAFHAELLPSAQNYGISSGRLNFSTHAYLCFQITHLDRFRVFGRAVAFAGI
jgi:hypothetical protein